MTNAEYFAAPGLSNSGMKDLEISPLRYWHRNINPDRVEDDETPAMRLGTALHCCVLEPKRFIAEYVRALNPADYEGLLSTMEDLRSWLSAKGLKPKGRTKDELAAQVIEADPSVPILSSLEGRFAQENEGRIVLSVDDYTRVVGMADSLLGNPQLEALLGAGAAEVALFATDPATGLPLKCKVDWLCEYCCLDLKTFSQQRGKTIDQTVADAIFYERYYRQAWFYSYVRSLAEKKPLRRSVFVFAFVESEEPYEVRIKELRPGSDNIANVYWDRGRIESRALIDTYAAYWKKYGEKPWRDEQEIVALIDDDIRQLAY